MKKILCLLYLFIFACTLNSQWVNVNSNITNDITNISFISYFTGYASTFSTSDSSGRIMKSVNGGINWFPSITQTRPMYNVYTPDASLVFGVGKAYVWVSTNGGNSWLERYFGDQYELYDIRFQNYLSAYVCGYNNITSRAILVRSSDRGTIWNVTFNLELNRRLYSVRFPNPIIGYACGEQGLMKKVVEGVTFWDTQNTPTTQNLNCLYFFNAETGFAAGNNSTLLRTTNGGSPWSLVVTGFTNVSFRSIQFYDNSTGYLVGSNGFIARSTNGGLNWVQQTTTNSNQINGINFINRDTLYAAGDAGTILSTFNGGNPIGINLISNSAPGEFKINQNYPNPFNPATNIEFEIPENSFVSLIVYDQLGKVVENLVNNELKPGTYKYSWNASSYPSGVYFYKIQAGEFVQTKKMILIK